MACHMTQLWQATLFFVGTTHCFQTDYGIFYHISSNLDDKSFAVSTKFPKFAADNSKS